MNPRIAFLTSTLGEGGIGKMMVSLTRELAHRDIDVDLVLGKVEGPFASQIDPRVRVFELGTSHAIFCLPRLTPYLRRERPTALVTDKLRVNLAALRGRRLARVDVRIYTNLHGVLSHKLDKENLSQAKRRSKYADIGKCYPLNDGFIPVSKAIGRDLVEHFKVPEHKVHVVYNPVVTPESRDQFGAEVDHPWIKYKDAPVVLGVGRLAPQKDFGALIRAFSLLRRTRKAKLIILGEGRERAALEALASETGVSEDVSMPGFVSNPYAFMSRSDLFVLSSAWEGFGIVLVEALAAGLPVVSADCPGGPREILQDGRIGPLVPVGDPDALSRAMLHTLDHPPRRALLEKAAEPFTAAACADGYLQALGIR
ncbi:MAG: glycosyltransferase [Desulfobacterales bacterium]|nr:glycosyltransferase [Desulfobacterales bacterium]